MGEKTLGSTTVVHVAIVVRDIEAKIEAWSALLGQPAPRVFMTGPLEETQTTYQGEPTPAQAKLAFFRVGQIQLELIEPVGEPSTWHEQLNTQGESLHHIAFVDPAGRLPGWALRVCGRQREAGRDSGAAGERLSLP
jgi:methylmalonyl-CoA/ethylmalonyl-CoA epimerase